MASMNTGVNNKRVFYVAPHRPQGFAEMLGKRDDVRLDVLEQKTPDEAALRFSPPRTPIRPARPATSWCAIIRAVPNCWAERPTC